MRTLAIFTSISVGEHCTGRNAAVCRFPSIQARLTQSNVISPTFSVKFIMDTVSRYEKIYNSVVMMVVGYGDG